VRTNVRLVLGDGHALSRQAPAKQRSLFGFGRGARSSRAIGYGGTLPAEGVIKRVRPGFA
jgi:hypothetical protein